MIYISELFAPGQLKEVIRRTGCGLETIALSVSDNLDQEGQTGEHLKDLIQKLGSPRLSVHGPFLDLNPMSFDSRIRQVTMERFLQAYGLARHLGADRVIFHSGMIPTVYYEEGWARREADFWQEFLDRTKKGPPVCMENVLDRRALLFAQVLERVKDERFGICLDLGHAHCYGQDEPLVWAEMLKGRIRHVHLHDNDGTRDAHLALGEGTLPYRELIQKIAGENPQVSWTVECSRREDALLSLERAYRALAGQPHGHCPHWAGGEG